MPPTPQALQGRTRAVSRDALPGIVPTLGPHAASVRSEVLYGLLTEEVTRYYTYNRA